MSIDDPELKELVQEYRFEPRTVRVFRHSVLTEYIGPLNSGADIASFIFDDAQVYF
jgi:hypothetical protein